MGRLSMTKSSLLACAALTSMVMVPASAALALESQCVRGDGMIRRVEIAAQDVSSGVPCEVVYWKDTEDPGVRRILWNARTDAAFCKRKADELVAKLTAGGWQCNPVGEGPAPRQAAPATPASPPAAVATARPASPPAPSGDTAAAAPPRATAPAGDTIAAAPRPAPEPAVRDALAPQDRNPPADATAAAPEADRLRAIIEQNLTRLNDGVDGEFAASIAGYGDLDGDGNQDGLVLFTYESQRLGQARFVAAYLFDGKTYVLAATKPLAGSDEQVQDARIESIDDGVISVRLNVLEPGDAACCPSGIRRQTLMLRNGELIDVQSSAGVGDNPS